MTIRTPFQKMTVDFFESIGAKPQTFTLNQLYQVLKEQTVDGQTDPYQIIVSPEALRSADLPQHHQPLVVRIHPERQSREVKALPAEIQAVITRHADAAALAQRQDVAKIDAGALEVLRAKGMTVNETDTSASAASSAPSMHAGRPCTATEPGRYSKRASASLFEGDSTPEADPRRRG